MTLKNIIAFVLLLFIITINCAKAQTVFEEKESIVIVEIESSTINNSWLQGSGVYEEKPITYYYNHVSDYYSNPGNGVLEYKIKINETGIYRFQWHCKVGEGSKSTEANDSWLKIADATEFYAEKLSTGFIRDDLEPVGNRVRPKGICTDDCPHGAGKNGWFKVYSRGTTDWTWSSSVYDKDPHEVFVRFDQEGEYTIQISARSKHQYLDKFMLYKPSVYTEEQAIQLAFSENNTVVNSIRNPLLNEMDIYPNPASNYLNLDCKEYKFKEYRIINLTGDIVLHGEIKEGIHTIELSSLNSGIYILQCIDIKGNPVASRIEVRKK